MSALDRIKLPLAKFIDSLTRRMDYLALYPCKVVAQNGDGSLELQPDDSRIPALSRVPMRLGIPGSTATVQAGARVLLTWAGGDPRLPIALAWEASGLSVLSVGPGPLDFVALAAKVDQNFQALKTLFNGWTPVPSDGGAVLKTAATALIATGWPSSTPASSLKVT
jgi:hypothetical protein